MSRTLSVFVSSLVLALGGPLRSADAQPAPIVGGTAAPAGKWNDVVAVIAKSGSCSGTLIAPDVVLTAGHCIELEPYEVITNTINFGRPGGDHIPVKWARAYPDWAYRYDVGVLMLEHVARPRPRPIAAACHTNSRLLAGAPLTIVGFGLVTPTGSDDNTRLHEATAPVLDPLCTSAPGCEPSVRPNGEFTAGGRGTDSCFGDSGGPAFLETAAGPALVGVVSRGLALPGVPCGNGGVYVRADKVVSWAQSITDRQFVRTTCDGERDDRGDDPGISDEESGGCSVTRGSPISAALGLLIAVSVLRRRRRGAATTAALDAVRAASEVVDRSSIGRPASDPSHSCRTALPGNDATREIRPPSGSE